MTLTWLPKIRACHPHVACTRNAEISVAHLLVPVYQDTLDLHRPVDQNVVSTPIVPWILPAWTRNAEILVKELVALRPYARFTITCQYALVPNDTLVILSAIVILLLDQVRNLKKVENFVKDLPRIIYLFVSQLNQLSLILVHHYLVVQTRNATMVFVHVWQNIRVILM